MKFSQAAPGAAPGEGTSPAMTWANVPAGTQSFVLHMHDLDVARNKTSDDQAHWVVWNIPATATGLPEGVPRGVQLADGSYQISVTGQVYRGPGAPASGPPAPLRVRALCAGYDARCEADGRRLRDTRQRHQGDPGPHPWQSGVQRVVQAAAVLTLNEAPSLQVQGGVMRQVSALMLGAAIGMMAPLGAAGRAEPIQAQNPAPPPGGFRIIGNIHWVGGEYGSYLITTPQGHILHDTGTSEMHDVIVSNVKKLGFDVKDIKMIISSHAHFDHVQGHAAMKKLTGAQVIALGGDAVALEAGQDNSAGGFPGWWPSMSIGSSRTGIRFPWAA